MVGKLVKTIPKTNLQPISVFDDPFSRIITDSVGPWPKTKSGLEYLLTIMCASTRFQEAIPLRNIKTRNIVQALVKFFTFVGPPKSVQSKLFSRSCMNWALLSINHLTILKDKERFHQTVKNMIRLYCFDTEKHWNEGIRLLLFVVRESVQESLDFSPFELVFGHTVRGLVKLLKEKFLSNDESSLNLL